MDKILDTLSSKINLVGEKCHLKHSPFGEDDNPPAVDYLCQKLGDVDSGAVLQEIRIPICAECVKALQDPNWILVYCTYCHKSQWIYKPSSKYNYPQGNGIYFLDICPHCAVVEDEFDKEM